MSGGVIPLALKALERGGRFPPAPDLAQYLKDRGIGTWINSQVILNPSAKQRLAEALRLDFQVPLGTSAADWENKSRTEALSLATNEKTTRRAVRSNRVAVKAFRGKPLHMNGQSWNLPPGASIDTEIAASRQFAAHRTAVLVENWEAFERIDHLSFEVPSNLIDSIVVYRGDKAAYPIFAARKFLAATGVPIYVFPDADPAGLVLARTFPGYAGLMLPALNDLISTFQSGRGDRERYLSHLKSYEVTLDAEKDPVISAYWAVMKKFGRALPQEEFVRVNGKT